MSSRRPIFVSSTASGRRDAASAAATENVTQFHRSLPSYAQTPLVPLHDQARELGVREVLVKYEGSRLGLPSFKILGASWGCYRAVAAHFGFPPKVGLDELKGRVKEADIVLVAATDGNHGRAVAFMARLLCARARIYVPHFVGEKQRGRIEEEGADVVVVHGDYDQAVRAAWDMVCAGKEKAGGRVAIMVQDNAFDGYEEVPAWIVEGYSTLLAEMEEQLDQLGLSASLVITPVGVGSLAHAVVQYCKSVSRPAPVSVAAVESDSAPCLFTSLRAGTPTSVSTSGTIMDGMNCGTVSSIAWPDLRDLVDASITVSSYEADRAVHYLASHSVKAGPCGAAPFAALRRLATEKEGRNFLHKDSVVVLLCTEGAREYETPLDVSVEDAVGLTQMLTRINSSNPTLSLSDGAGEGRIAAYLEAWFAYRDIECHRVERVAGRPSVVGILRGRGEHKGKSLMFNGHLDTVSLTSHESDPLSGALTEKDGQQVIVGRGSLDMKGGLAAALASMAATKSNETLQRQGDLIVAAVADEEDASQGTQDVLDAGWRADMAILGEPTMLAIATAHKGFMWAQVDILGVAAHGSNPAEGEDAILHAGWFLCALEQYYQRQHPLPADETLGQATVHCGLIQGGVEASSYPEKCTITIEFRTVPNQTEQSVLDHLNILLKSVAEDHPRLFRYAAPRITLSRPWQKIDPSHPFVQKTVFCASSVLGHKPAIQSIPFWTDAALLDRAGIPSLVFGPAGKGIHSREEWVTVESLRQLEKIYVQLVEQLTT